MQKKQKQRKVIIFVLAVFIALLVVTMINGNKDQVSVVVVNGEIDISQPLSSQTNKFKTVNISRNEAQQLEGVLTDFNLLTRDTSNKAVQKWLSVQLAPGTPVPVALIVDSKPIGKFAQSLAKNKTYYKFPGGEALLPPGVAEGDLIDIALYTQEGKDKKEITPFMEDVTVALIVKETRDLYIEVSQSDAYRLTIAQDSGKFILQLPGRKDVVECSTLTEEQKLTSDCYNEDDAPSKVTLEDIKKQLEENKKNSQSNNNTQTHLSDEQLKAYEEAIREADRLKQQQEANSGSQQ